MSSFRRVLLSFACIAAAAAASAQNPGDPIEYRALRWPEKWEVGTLVRVLAGGTHVVVRLAPSPYLPAGAERTFAMADVRPARHVAPPHVAPPARTAAPSAPPAPMDFFGVARPGATAPEIAPAPAPARAVAPPAVTVLPACGPRPSPEKNRLECVQQVQGISSHWGACEAGNGVACHRFVRDVARALQAGDPRWGLITKPRGQQACTEQACGRDITGGYGEDMVAYLPPGHGPNQWLGSDIIGGAGAPGARIQWANPEGYVGNRSDNHWSAVPR